MANQLVISLKCEYFTHLKLSDQASSVQNRNDIGNNTNSNTFSSLCNNVFLCVHSSHSLRLCKKRLKSGKFISVQMQMTGTTSIRYENDLFTACFVPAPFSLHFFTLFFLFAYPAQQYTSNPNFIRFVHSTLAVILSIFSGGYPYSTADEMKYEK